MKRLVFLVLIAVIGASALFAVGNLNGTRMILPEPSDLSATEAADVLFMLEEEKLARDVYAALFEAWNYPVFSNISSSEQQHMDSLLVLVDRYELANPIEDIAQGEFVSAEFQTLYNDLVESGSASLVDAFTVGATIEDLDIADLRERIEDTDNADIIMVYENLIKGSENHLRSFVSQLERQGATYEVRYMSEEEAAAIIG